MLDLYINISIFRSIQNMFIDSDSASIGLHTAKWKYTETSTKTTKRSHENENSQKYMEIMSTFSLRGTDLI